MLREADRRIGLLDRLAKCFRDGRDPDLIEHAVGQLLAQRVYGLALGYEDMNDHDELRGDALLGLVSGKARPVRDLLAGKSTLHRFELSTGTQDRYKRVVYQGEKLDELYVPVFLEAHARAPELIVIDMDTTDVGLHGHQVGRFFHGYYDPYCYLPLNVFGEEHLLGMRLRTADQDAGESAAHLSLGIRLYAVHRHAPIGTGGHGIGTCAGQHDPLEAAAVVRPSAQRRTLNPGRKDDTRLKPNNHAGFAARKPRCTEIPVESIAIHREIALQIGSRPASRSASTTVRVKTQDW